MAAASIVLLLSACASQAPKGTLYWGDYSDTLYEYKQTPGEATLAAHMAELQRIIQVSDDREYRIPPGVSAELGMYFQRTGNPQQASALFTREQVLYPESIPFMTKFLQQTSSGTEESQSPAAMPIPEESVAPQVTADDDESTEESNH